MKILDLFLVFIFLATLNSCYNYKIKRYEVDSKTGKPKLVGYDEYSHNMTPDMIEAHNKKKVMGNMAEQLKPHSKTDSIIYMDQDHALAAMEIGGRYYLSTGYGTKNIDSQDGTVVGSLKNKSSKSSTVVASKYDGFDYDTNSRRYYWDEHDPDCLYPIEISFLKTILKNPGGPLAKEILKDIKNLYPNK